MEVSYNRDTPKSSIAMGIFPLQTIQFGGTPMAMETPDSPMTNHIKPSINHH